jgi:hypothetical protein
MNDLDQDRLPVPVKTSEQEALWFEATLDASVFFAYQAMEPEQASMLLCRFNPNTDTPVFAETSSTDETSADDFKRLRSLFIDRQRAEPVNRSLLDWIAVADGAACKYHSWVQRYSMHRDLLVELTVHDEVALSGPEALPVAIFRRRAQEAAILAAIRDMGNDPQKIPKFTPGKPGLKFDVRKTLAVSSIYFPIGGTQFNKAWDELRKSGEISEGEITN